MSGANSRMLRWLGALWTAPNTALGLMLATAGWCRLARRSALALEVVPRGGRGPWAWIFARGWTGITFGQVIIHAGPAQLADEEHVRHELRHVLQALVLGPAYLPVYLLGALWGLGAGVGAWRREGCWPRRAYHRLNPLEMDARRAAGQA